MSQDLNLIQGTVQCARQRDVLDTCPAGPLTFGAKVGADGCRFWFVLEELVAS